MVARDGDLGKLKALLKDNPYLVFSKDNKHYGETPLHWAVSKGNKDMAELLLASKAEVNAQEDHDETPLHKAASEGYMEMAELLLASKAEVDAKDRNGWTPLHLTAFRGNREVAELLLANKADVNARDYNGETPLHRAVIGRQKEVVELLLANKADVNAKTHDGTTPLYRAAVTGYKEVVELLLANKADVNVKTNDGETPLHYAAVEGFRDVAKLLAAHTIVSDDKDNDGHGPLDAEAAHVAELLQLADVKAAKRDAMRAAEAAHEAELVFFHNFRSWESSGEPKAWVEKHIQGWNHNEWLELLASLRESLYWPMNETKIGLHLEKLRAELGKAAVEDSSKQLAVATGHKAVVESLGTRGEMTRSAKPASRRLLKDQYELLDEVGRGGFGAVYKARDVHLDQFVAVKELTLENPSALKEEAKVLSELRHKNIVGFRQLFFDSGRWYLVIDYVEGANLAVMIRDRPLYAGGNVASLRRMLMIATQSAEGLGYAHERHVVHQDVKPSNVMVTKEGVAKVSDFGLARAQPASSGVSPSRPEHSHLVSMNGLTPAYCSPEQAAHQQVTRKTDTWSWGLLVLEMFQGEVTWMEGTTAPEVLNLYAREGARNREIPKMPRALVKLLRKCFASSPHERPDMQSIAEALRGIDARL